MTLDLSHLVGSARQQAFESTSTRVRLVQEARWISHVRAQQVLEELQWRYEFPVCSRMPCLLVYGDSGMGKTMVIEKFAREHPIKVDAQHGIAKRDILILQMPPAPDERRFYAKLLESLHAPFSPSARLVALEIVALRLLRKIELKMLVIDEVHQMLAGTYREQRRALNLLKSLTNELMIPVVVVGTEDALHAVQTDSQVASRFDPIRRARWTESEAFRNFLVAFGKLLPLAGRQVLDRPSGHRRRRVARRRRGA
jgi:Bacterial TniB protein